MQFPLIALAIATTVVVQPLVDRDVLEPSVQNEVDHALAKASNCRIVESSNRQLPFPTNGMSRTDIAIRLVSAQRSDGRWRVGTNDVTAVAVELLKSL